MKYNLNSEQKGQIIDLEHEILQTTSTPLNPELLDLILNKYSTNKPSLQDSISLNPVGPLLKISYLYDCGEWDLAVEQIAELLNEIFETKITLESIQTYSLAKFWSALLSYQISNKQDLQLAPNYPQISSECGSVHIPSIPHGFLVAMEYIYILLRYFKREISSFFIKELEFALKTLMFIFNLFSNQFYLVLSFVCCSIYQAEFCTNTLDFAVQTLNDFTEFLIENGYQNTFQSLQDIYELQNGVFQNSDDSNNDNILRYSKSHILAQFLKKSNDKLQSHTNSNSLKLLMESEFEYFALKNTDTISANKIRIYTHSHLISLCDTFRKFAVNVLTNSFTENAHFSDKRIPFSILPSFLQRVFRISQILIQSGATQEATAYIDLGFQISGKLNLFEWRLQFLILGIQLDVIREKIDRIEEYSSFISKMRNVLSETDRNSPDEAFDGFSHLLTLKKLKINRVEFKYFCCLTRNFDVISNQLILQNFNDILRSTSNQILEVHSQSFSKADYKNFHENIQEILTNFHTYFHRIKKPEIPAQILKIPQFPPNEHLPHLKISQIQSLTNQMRESNSPKSALSVYKMATKLINGMQSHNSVFMAQPSYCQSLSEFYLQAGKSLSKDSGICDNPKCCLFNPKYEISKHLQEIHTNCIQSTIPYGSVLALKYSLTSLGELFSESDPILSSAYFNVAFGISLRHLFLNKHSVSKYDYFDLFCFDSVTHNPQNCLEDNFLSSLTNLQPNWTILTISWPKKGDNLFITRLRNGRPPILLKIPILQLTPPKFDSKNWQQNTNELKSLEDILSSIFDLLHEASKPENIVNKSKWWVSRTKANTALSETLSQIESEWFSLWKGIFLGKISISQEFVSTSVKELIQFIQTIIDIPPFQYELCSELFEVILESYPLLKRAQMELILPQIFPDLEQNNCKIISKKIAIISEELYEKIADFLDKFECTPQSVPRGHIFLILDPYLHRIPWENLPILSTQSVSRIPSLHFLFMLTHKYSPHSNIDLTNGFYVLNPQGDLLKCENDFQKLFRSLKWDGVAGEPPEGLIDSVSKHDLYVYCGHGSGSEYINKDKLLNIKGRAFTMLMGCSTSRLSIEGPYEYPNMLLLLLLAGFPTIIGTLWFVTDSEINLFTKKLIQEIVKNTNLRFTQGLDRSNTLSMAFHQARLSCKLRYITGAAPIIYGLPLY
ncbi:Separin-like [Oopsacas minuta]|uniref:separase n=1 Tax=Oopsacas minuta TaxID=111878 RepID=A0AAV7JK96_9METZ|nr:Separin-like [Oopsacas minuta]